jgi:predicted site-specific integrase-resolvase
MNRLLDLPEDILVLIYKWVFKECAKQIDNKNARSLYDFYDMLKSSKLCYCINMDERDERDDTNNIYLYRRLYIKEDSRLYKINYIEYPISFVCADFGYIRTIIEEFASIIYNDDNEEELNKLKIIYVRVSSMSQKNDLERQKIYMQKRYPGYLLIEDIGSGLNFNRRGLRKIIKYAISGKIEELVVAYKDRLARFGFELIEDLIKEYSNGRIIILNKNKDLEPEEELVKDMLQIMNIFTAKMNGLRKYKEKD